ncbi:MAG: hypothetical protein LBI61_01580 [Puniceicoccales bacterium]|jgi:hypothetical protein|nr:hypothetical protein [Puniceicoccales bacterium]
MSTSTTAAVATDGYDITQGMLDAVTNPFLKLDEAEILLALDAKEKVIGKIKDDSTITVDLIKSGLLAAGYTESEIAAVLRREAEKDTASGHTAAVLALVKGKMVNRGPMWMAYSDADLIAAIEAATGETCGDEESLEEFLARSALMPEQISGNALLAKFFNALTPAELWKIFEDETASLTDLKNILAAEQAVVNGQIATLGGAGAGKFYFFDGAYSQVVLQQIYEALLSEESEEKKKEVLIRLYGSGYVETYGLNYTQYKNMAEAYWTTGAGADSVFGRLKQAEVVARNTAQYIELYGTYDASSKDAGGNPIGTKENPAPGSLWDLYLKAQEVKEEAYSTMLIPGESLAEVEARCNAAEIKYSSLVTADLFEGWTVGEDGVIKAGNYLISYQDICKSIDNIKSIMDDPDNLPFSSDLAFWEKQMVGIEKLQQKAYIEYVNYNGEYTSIADVDRQLQLAKVEYDSLWFSPLSLPAGDLYEAYNGQTINGVLTLLQENKDEWVNFYAHVKGILRLPGKTIKTLEEEYNDAKAVADAMKNENTAIMAQADLFLGSVFNYLLELTNSFITAASDLASAGATYGNTAGLGIVLKEAAKHCKESLEQLKDELDACDTGAKPIDFNTIIGDMGSVLWYCDEEYSARGSAETSVTSGTLDELLEEAKGWGTYKSAAGSFHDAMANFREMFDKYYESFGKAAMERILNGNSLDSLNLPSEEYALLSPYFNEDETAVRVLSGSLAVGLIKDVERVLNRISSERKKSASEFAAADAIKGQKEKAYKDALLVGGVDGPYNEILAAYYAALDAYSEKLKEYESSTAYGELVRAQILYEADLKALARLDEASGATMNDLLSLCLAASTPTPNENGEYGLVSGVKRVEQTTEDGKINYKYELVYSGETLSKERYDASFTKEDGYAHLSLPYFSLAIMYEKVTIQQMILAEQIEQIEKINKEIKTNNEMIKVLSWMYEKVYAEAVKNRVDAREGAITNDQAKTQCGVSIRELDDYLKNFVKNGGLRSSNADFCWAFNESYGVNVNGTFAFAVSHYSTEGDKWTDHHDKDFSNVDVQEQATLTMLSNFLDQTRLYGDQLSTDANLMTTKMQQYVQEANACLNACSQTVKSIGDYYKTTISNIR